MASFMGSKSSTSCEGKRRGGEGAWSGQGGQGGQGGQRRRACTQRSESFTSGDVV